MEKITLWLQNDLPVLLKAWSEALLTTSVLVQLAVVAAILLFMFPFGSLLVSLFRKTCHRLEIGQRIAMLLNRIRVFFFRPPLTEDGAIRVFSILQSLEALGRPIAAFLLLKLGVNVLAGFKDLHTHLLLRILPLFLVWAVYRWLCAVLPIFFREEAFEPLRRRLLRPLFWIACILQLFQQLEATLLLAQKPFLKLAGAPLTLKNMFLAFLILYVFLKLSSHTRHFLQEGLLPKLKVTSALNNTLATFVSYMLIGFGFFMAISTLGFNASSLTVLFGALTVGIGFGLQSIINNFVSGLILLAEQSIAPGDVINVDNKVCIVEHIRIRSTTVRTFENIELRVPNSKLLGDIVQSLTGGDAKTRTSIRVGVSYSDDPRTVEAILLQAAAAVEDVLDRPAPAVAFVDYGDNAIVFDLIVWVDHPKRIPATQSSLRFHAWYGLQQAGVSFPFPQRDLNLGQGWEGLLKSGQEGLANQSAVASPPTPTVVPEPPVLPRPPAPVSAPGPEIKDTKPASALSQVLGEAPSVEQLPAADAKSSAPALKEILGETSSEALAQPENTRPTDVKDTRSMTPFRPFPDDPKPAASRPQAPAPARAAAPSQKPLTSQSAPKPRPRQQGGFFAPPLPDDKKS